MKIRCIVNRKLCHMNELKVWIFVRYTITYRGNSTLHILFNLVWPNRPICAIKFQSQAITKANSVFFANHKNKSEISVCLMCNTLFYLNTKLISVNDKSTFKESSLFNNLFIQKKECLKSPLKKIISIQIRFCCWIMQIG